MSQAPNPFETMESSDSGSVRQISIFCENQVGQLLRLVRLLEASEIRVLSVTMVYSVDCTILRLIADRPDEACKVLRDAGFAFSVCEILLVELKPGDSLLRVCKALLGAEANISYGYPLLIQPTHQPVLALHVDDLTNATKVLNEHRFHLLTESDLPPHFG